MQYPLFGGTAYKTILNNIFRFGDSTYNWQNEGINTSKKLRALLSYSLTQITISESDVVHKPLCLYVRGIHEKLKQVHYMFTGQTYVLKQVHNQGYLNNDHSQIWFLSCMLIFERQHFLFALYTFVLLWHLKRILENFRPIFHSRCERGRTETWIILREVEWSKNKYCCNMIVLLYLNMLSCTARIYDVRCRYVSLLPTC